MKAKLTRDQTFNLGKEARAQELRSWQRGDITKEEFKRRINPQAKAGTIIEAPNAYLLVRLGVAVAADVECQIAAGFSPEQVDAAQDAATRLERAHATGSDEFDGPASIEENNDNEPTIIVVDGRDLDDTGDESGADGNDEQ